MRVVSSQIGLIKEATGSARFQSGQTIVVASVYGPNQPRYSRHEEFDRATLEINFNLAALANVSSTGSASSDGNRGSLSPDAEVAVGMVGSIVASTSSSEVARGEREGIRILKHSLLSCIDVKACPRTLIVISVCVLRNDGGIMSAAINACSLALLNAGIPLLYFPMAATYLVFNEVHAGEGDAMGLLDPTAEQEAAASSKFLFTLRHAVTNGSQGVDNEGNLVVTMMQASGNFTNNHLDLASRETIKGCQELSKFFRNAIKTS